LAGLGAGNAAGGDQGLDFVLRIADARRARLRKPRTQNRIMKTEEIARRLVALCREQKWEEAQRELYAKDAVSLEPHEMPGFPKETKGLPGIFEKGKRFTGMVETMHSLEVSEPLVASNSFACTMTMDVTMRGQGRMQMAELCVYEVKDGKIILEQFHI
jgi:hypothetical protein